MKIVMVWFSHFGNPYMKKQYIKPHLTFERQLAQLADRGLEIEDDQECISALMRIGYYRFSAYLYPFRKMKPKNQRSSQWNYRFDEFEAGHSFQEAFELYEFDQKLKALTFVALEAIEVALRTQIAYHAGREDKFIHLHRESLDAKECDEVPQNSDKSAYEWWLKNYSRQLRQAKSEDFIRHHSYRYGEDIPIWIAVEFLDFGSITKLFEFLPVDLKNDIAPHFGIITGQNVASWFRNFNYVRNKIAHHSRLWNRLMVIKVARPNKSVVDPGIFHLADASNRTFNKIYPTLALLAYVLSFVDPADEWRLQIAELMRQFPSIDGIGPVETMGFPQNWESLALWRTDWVFQNGAAVPPWVMAKWDDGAVRPQI